MSVSFDLRTNLDDLDTHHMGESGFDHLRIDLARKINVSFGKLQHKDIREMNDEESALYFFFINSEYCEGEITVHDCKILYNIFKNVKVEEWNEERYQKVMTILKYAMNSDAENLNWY